MSTGIPIKILKYYGCIFDILKNCINQSIETSNFPDCLKMANITPFFKNDSSLDKLSFRSVSILPLLSKVYETFVYNQLYEFTGNISNSIICGFRKRVVHSIHYLSYYNCGKGNR